MALLDKIKKLCFENSITLAKLEKILNFGNGTLSRWDNSSPSGDKLTKVADYFGVSVDYLLERTDNPIANATNDFDTSYFKVMKEAKDSGISPHDLDLAIDFLKRARNKDKEITNNWDE